MTVKVFLTGASGYVGGDALHHVYTAHPDYEYTLLVKNEQQAEPIKAKYPNVKFVYGTLEQSDLVRDTCLDTHVVIHTADSADNVPGTVAIAKGLEEGHSKENPAYWIHTSGTAILNFYDADKKRYGEAPVPEEAYHDIKDIKRLVSLPDDAPHRNVDLMVQEVPSDIVKVAIISPPTIYDAGAGTIRTLSRQVPLLVRVTLKNGYAPIIGAGKTEWDHVNVSDLGDLFVKLLDASQDSSKNGNPEIFGPNAYYFAENGTHKWAEVAEWVAEECHRQGYISEPATKKVTLDEATAIGASKTYALNSKGTAERARQYLGWQPKGRSLKDSLADLVKEEAEKLNLKPNKE